MAMARRPERSSYFHVASFSASPPDKRIDNAPINTSASLQRVATGVATVGGQAWTAVEALRKDALVRATFMDGCGPL
jgi:hypothetical protein